MPIGIFYDLSCNSQYNLPINFRLYIGQISLQIMNKNIKKSSTRGVSANKDEARVQKRRRVRSNHLLIIGHSRKSRAQNWTEEEDRKLFKLYKEKGSRWSLLASQFPGRNENQIKNRFYSTLRRLAKKSLTPAKQKTKIGKDYLIQFVDDAILYGHNCRSKRGRKPKGSKRDYDSSGSEKDRENKSVVCISEEGGEENLKLGIDEPREELKHGFLNIQETSQFPLVQHLVRSDNNALAKSFVSEENREDFNDLQLPNTESPYHFPNLLLVDPNYIQLLIQQNDEALAMLEDKTKQTINDPQELQELLKGMKDKLKETQKTVRAIYDKYAAI